MLMTETGETVYQRTYSRTKPDGSREVWPETVQRVVDGNLALGDHRHDLPGERDNLIRLMTELKIVPAGRHLWASGVQGRQYLFNCHVAGWGEKVTEHFEFTFLRLMEGGGVGSNYSNRYLNYPKIRGFDISPTLDYMDDYEVHIVCDPEHPDYQKMLDAGVLSTEYVSDWDGCFEVDDSREGWAAALVDLIETYYRPAKHAKRVFDVSRVRGEGERLKTFGGRASGPLPLARMLHEVAEILNARIGNHLDGIGAMEIDHAIATCVVSGGNRRSARMAIMHWNDPQIFQFIKAKETTGKHWTTNISVEVDTEFWAQQEFCGSHGKDVLYTVAERMLSNGEPGLWNSELSNVGEPNPVIATNPCGEIPLEEWENCNLGHVNLAAFVDPATGAVDLDDMYLAHELMTRYLIRATNGDVNDEKQAAKLARNRRIGVGHLGVASFLAMTGQRYSEAPSSPGFKLLLESMADVVTAASVDYAHDLRIPVPVKTRTVAPTGTIAKMPGVSEGVHPIFSKFFVRRIRFSMVDPEQMAQVRAYEEKGYDVEPCQYAPETLVVSIPTKDRLVADVEAIFGEERALEIVEAANDLTIDDMLAFQRLYQIHWADNAVSYTVNIETDTMEPSDLYSKLLRYGPSLKGTTIFPDKGFAQAPYERISKADYDLYEYALLGDGVDEACASGACPVR
jgi:ribonucleoside-triphosphate reductase